MSRKLRFLLSAVFIVTALLAANVVWGQSRGSIQVTKLTTEYATNPLGIDVIKPRLSWQLQSSERGQYQTAYRIQVASSESNLLAGIADVWDTGKVDSDQSVNVEYGGKPLESRMRYYWRVKVWDKHGNESPWSEPAWWEMGLLDEADWQAEWIGLRVDKQDELTLDGAYWIWYPEGNPAVDAPVGAVYFRYAFQSPPVEQLTKAEMLLSADDVYLLYVNGAMADISPQETDAWKQARWIDLLPYLRTGSNVISIIAMNAAPTGSRNPAGLIGSLRIEHVSGASGVFRTNGEWKVSKAIETGWLDPGFDDSGWQNAMEVAVFGEGPWGTQVQRPTYSPAPLLRKSFTVEKTVKRARVYLSGLAYYNLYLNGEKVGDRVLDPAFTDYNDRVMYVTYDVTERIRQGVNAIGVELGRGFYGMLSPNVWNWHRAPWHDDPKLLLQLEIEYEDGTVERVVSDESWRATEGPTLYDSLYGGETYDARREKTGWTTAMYDDSRWDHAVRVTPPRGKLTAQLIDPIKVTETLDPVAITEPLPGVYVFDVGRAIAGWALISVSGQPGTKITLKYGETLNPDGTVRAHNEHIHDGRFQIDEYILKGGGTEVWEPNFSYKGFRYVQVTGLQETPTTETLKGRVVHSAVRQVGDFVSSNELYNWIHTAMQRTILNNLHSIPTDTPKYEKNGWTADAHLGSLSMIYNFDMVRFLSKWIDDIRDSQLASGQIPQIVPTSGWGLNPSPDWTSAYPIVVWALYEHYDDRRLMEDHYDALKNYVEWEIRRLNNGISSSVLGDWMAPWGGWNPPEDTRLAATAYVYRALTIMADIARVLGNDEDELRYASIAEEVKQAFNREFLNYDAGYYETQQDPNYRQTSNLLPLAFGMVPVEYEQAVIESVVKDIEARDWHLNTGVLGTNVLLPVLTEYGYGDVAYAVSNQRTYPSWGFWYANGATSLWEEWGLNSRSQNHLFFGTIDHWFFQYVGGIRPAAPGFKRMLIKPYIVGDLTHARATTETPYGQVTSAWRLDEQSNFTLEVEIPVNTTATVYVPFGGKWGVTEGGRPAHNAEGVRFLGLEGDYAVYEVGSGSYRFTVHPPGQPI